MNSNQTNSKKLNYFIETSFPHYESKKEIKKGRNAKLWLLDLGHKKIVIKQYNDKDKNSKRKLDAEINFLEYCNKKKINSTPTLLIYNKNVMCIAMSFLPGETIKEITAHDIDECANFIIQLNKNFYKNLHKQFSYASDACITKEDHISLIEEKLFSTKTFIPTNIKEKEIYDWLNSILEPNFIKAKAKVLQAPSFKNINTKSILSPSDFGFHNMLKSERGIQFCDFEHSGLDSIVKLCCDFCLQPDYSVNYDLSSLFIKTISKEFNFPDLSHTVKILTPLHKIKWILIILNSIHKNNQEKLEFAVGNSYDTLILQFEKAKKYFQNN